ncbi:MAG: hypothetical protein GY722_10240, partial [bacterium]|nr:hypothetical protein [bacterium]
STPRSTTTYVWDDNGNRLEQQGDGAAAYSWSPRNELAGFQASGIDVDYAYDALGALIGRTSSDTDAEPVEVSMTDWMVDESGARPRVVAELDGSSQSLDAVYVVEPSDGTPLARSTPGGMSYFHTDGLGSVTGISNPGGQLAGRFSYQPFGLRSPADGPEFGFAGELQDPRIGLVHLRARWLDTVTGSFLSMDPFAGTTEPLFAYAANDPINRIDPSGLFSVAEANIAGTIASMVSGLEAEAFYIFIAGIEEGTAGVLNAIKESVKFAVLGAAAALILGVLIKIVRDLRRAAYGAGSGAAKAAKSRLYYMSYATRTDMTERLRNALMHMDDGTVRYIVSRNRTLVDAYVDVGGQQRQIVGISARRGPGLDELVASRSFGFGTPELAPDVAGNFPKANDAEMKIIQFLRQELRPSDSGTIALYIDHPKGPCTYCRDAIKEFAQDFPDINVLVFVYE